MLGALLTLLHLTPTLDASSQAPKTPEEVIIFADPYARWDHTRWYAETQLAFPLPFLLLGRLNHEMRVSHVQLRTSILCDKSWRRGEQQFEVVCDIEAVGLQAMTWERHGEEANTILQELDDDLTAASLRLYVTDDGRVDHLSFDHFPAEDRRSQVRRENVRQLWLRLISGFHLHLPQPHKMVDQQWVEYESALMSLPTPLLLIQGSKPMLGELAAQPRFASMGGSTLVHRLDPFRGVLVVQSRGQGTLWDGAMLESLENFYRVELQAVAVYHPESGIMTERVYSVFGHATASSATAEAMPGAVYAHSGRLRQLGEHEVIDTGPTGRAVPASQLTPPGVLTWRALE